MKKITSYIFIVNIFIGTLFIASCKKYLSIPPPNNQLLNSNVFNSASGANAAVVGMYSAIMQNQNPVSFSSYNGSISADEIFAPLRLTDERYQNNIPADFSELNINWNFCYSFIYVSNSILEGLSNSGNAIDSSIRARLGGEAKFVRALSHFYLTNFWGDVPLITSKDLQTNDTISRTPQSQVYLQIIKDLQDAAAVLPEDYSLYGGEKIRPNKYAALALLARVYLYTERWAEAETAASQVIESGKYSMLTDLDQVFLSNADEAVLQFAPVVGYTNTFDATTFIPSASVVVPTYVLTPELLQSFAAADIRKSHWIASNIVDGESYYYPFKYKNNKGTPVTEYLTVLRYAELFLIRSEARTHLQKFSEAQDDLNVIRNRAQVTPSTASDEPSLLLAIEQERRWELFAESGHRWFDLKRTRRADAVLGAIKPSWKPTAALFPIPAAQLRANPRLKQNPGYE